MTTIHLVGQVQCHGELVLDERKILDRNERNEVLGQFYSYQARFAPSAFHSNQRAFRYDNAHDDSPHLGHDDGYHNHVFNPYTGEEVGFPLHAGRANWPTLTRVILELHEWWLHYHPDPRIYPLPR